MDTHEWLDEVAQQLHSSSTSLAYQRRLMDELRDHINDLTCDERNHAMSAEAVSNQVLESRLGTPQEIAKATESIVGRARFARRHPIVTFLLLPIPMLLILCAAYCLALVGIIQLFESYRDQSWAIQLAAVLSHGLVYAPAVALTLLIGWVARRSQAKVAWWVAASVLVGFVSAMLMVSFQAPTTPGTGMLQVGFGIPPSLTHWPQFAVPLLVTLALVVYTIVQRRSDSPSNSV